MLVSAQLSSAAAPPVEVVPARDRSEYLAWQRVLGVYPISRWFLAAGVARYQAEALRRYQQPLAPLAAGAHRVLWQAPTLPTPPSAGQLANWLRPGQDVPLSPGQLDQLFGAHAPAFLVDTASVADWIAAPVLERGGPGADSSRPQVYVSLSHTRFGGVLLPQLLYEIWFSERPSRHGLDPYAGRLDGLIWRVTLGLDGRVLAYDSIHPCGCYHMVFPAQALRRKAALSGDAPLVLGEPLGDGPLAVQLSAGEHQILRVLPLAEASADDRRGLRLLPYSALQNVRATGGGSGSLFGAHGLVVGSERGERWWLWMSGVRSPGAMRDLGRHATAFVGQRHFDDPHWLDELFEPIAWPADAAHTASLPE